MLTEKQIEEKRNEIHNLKSQIIELNGSISRLECEIRAHFLEQVQNRWPDIKYGDLVVVEHRVYRGGLTAREDHYTTEPVFYCGPRYNKFAYELNDSNIDVIFKAVKKDGTMSQREAHNFTPWSILSIKKVEQ